LRQKKLQIGTNVCLGGADKGTFKVKPPGAADAASARAALRSGGTLPGQALVG
jgi:hypothetical protein